MDRFVEYDENRFVARYGDDFLFEVDFELESKIDYETLVNIFVLINKYYPSFIYYEGSVEVAVDTKWEDLILRDHDLLGDEASYFDICFNIPVFIDQVTELKKVYTSHGGLKVTHEFDKNDVKRLFVSFYANVYSGKNFKNSFDKKSHKWVQETIDQKASSALNREILASFLKELEVVVKSQIKGFESSKIDSEYLHKYGFDENVELRLI